MKTYFYQVLVAFDQFWNVVFGGKPDETISARSQRAAQHGNWFGKFMIWWLDKLQFNHGIEAEEGDLNRAEQVEKVEENSLNAKT